MSTWCSSSRFAPDIALRVDEPESIINEGGTAGILIPSLLRDGFFALNEK